MEKLNLDIDLLTSAINQTMYISDANNSQTNNQNEDILDNSETAAYCMFCSNNCSGSCSSGCYGCDGSCKGTCENRCYGTCDGSCKGDCDSSCKWTCRTSCYGSCDNTCSHSCDNRCKGTCENGCYGQTQGRRSYFHKRVTTNKYYIGQKIYCKILEINENVAILDVKSKRVIIPIYHLLISQHRINEYINRKMMFIILKTGNGEEDLFLTRDKKLLSPRLSSEKSSINPFQKEILISAMKTKRISTKSVNDLFVFSENEAEEIIKFINKRSDKSIISINDIQKII